MLQEIHFCFSYELKKTMDLVHSKGLKIVSITIVEWMLIDREGEHRFIEAERFMILAESVKYAE